MTPAPPICVGRFTEQRQNFAVAARIKGKTKRKWRKKREEICFDTCQNKTSPFTLSRWEKKKRWWTFCFLLLTSCPRKVPASVSLNSISSLRSHETEADNNLNNNGLSERASVLFLCLFNKTPFLYIVSTTEMLSNCLAGGEKTIISEMNSRATFQFENDRGKQTCVNTSIFLCSFKSY